MTANLEPQDLDRFRNIVARRFGLQVDNGNHDRLWDALQSGVRRTGCGDGRFFIDRLENGAWGRPVIAELVKDLTVAETYFFRHPDQYQAVLDRVILDRLRSDRPNKRLRVLSAGCASGEEAYSLAILINEHMPAGAGWDVGVCGIDINAGLLAKAAQGRYTRWSLRGVPDDVQQRHFQIDGGEFVLSASVRQLVKFTECNLADAASAFWQPAAFDLIFCRNVIMYFTPETARDLMGRFARSLSPDGFLFLGPAETLRGMAHDFHLQHTHETFYYQRRPEGEKSSQPPVESEVFAAPARDCVPFAAAADPSWVATICRASQRVASLSRDALRADVPLRAAGAGPRRERPEAPAAATAPRLGAVRQLVLEERFGEALAALEELPRLEGQNPDVKLLCAALLTNTGRMPEAERLCRDVLAHDELSAEAHYLLALCREHAGEIAAAIEQNEMAVYLDPQFAMPRLHLGLLKKRQGDAGSAREAFLKAAALFEREDASRIVMFGGGFGRAALTRLCHAEMRPKGVPA